VNPGNHPGPPKTEAQLARASLAHENLRTVVPASRHVQHEKNSKTTNIMAGLGQLASGILLGNGAGGQVAQAIIGGGAGSLRASACRETDEKQADLLGNRHPLYNSGYDPPRPFPNSSKSSRESTAQAERKSWTDHPNPGNRTEYVNAEIDTLAPGSPIPMVNSAAFKRAHDLAVKEPTPHRATNKRDGVWKNGKLRCRSARELPYPPPRSRYRNPPANTEPTDPQPSLAPN